MSSSSPRTGDSAYFHSQWSVGYQFNHCTFKSPLTPDLLTHFCSIFKLHLRATTCLLAIFCPQQNRQSVTRLHGNAEMLAIRPTPPAGGGGFLHLLLQGRGGLASFPPLSTWSFHCVQVAKCRDRGEGDLHAAPSHCEMLVINLELFVRGTLLKAISYCQLLHWTWTRYHINIIRNIPSEDNDHSPLASLPSIIHLG